MAVNVLEALIYGLVVSGSPSAASCTLSSDGVTVRCDNGMTVSADAGGQVLTYADGVTVTKQPDGSVVFSNGIEAHFDSFGWIEFSNGVAVRRETLPDRGVGFLVGGELFCQPIGRVAARCDPL